MFVVVGSNATPVLGQLAAGSDNTAGEGAVLWIIRIILYYVLDYITYSRAGESGYYGLSVLY